jgi:hypothetical protein
MVLNIQIMMKLQAQICFYTIKTLPIYTIKNMCKTHKQIAQ